jgi:hypothetical protein
MNELCGGINEFKKVSQPITNLVKGTKCVLNTCKKHVSQLLNIQGVNDVRQTEVHTTESVVPEPSVHDIEVSVGKFKNINIPCIGQIMRSEIHKLINCVWSKEDIFQHWKDPAVLPVYMEGGGHV